MNSETKTVGCVELGTTGGPIASNLVLLGLAVAVWNRTCAKLVVLAGGVATSHPLKTCAPKIFRGEFDPGSMVRLMLKDLGIVRDAAAALALPLNAAGLAESYLRAVAANRGGDLGIQAMSQTLEQLGGFKFVDGN